METLTLELAKEYLNRAVEEYGADYVDPNAAEEDGTCQNIYLGPSDSVEARCIAAQALSYHGVTDDDLRRFNDSGAGLLMDKLDLPHSNGARALLGQAQRYQDNGHSWGEALSRAIEWVEEGQVEPSP